MSDMTVEFFMAQIKTYVRDASVCRSLSRLEAPPGRSPRVRHVQQSEWFVRLCDADKKIVESVLVEVIDDALFGLFSVLDSVRTIDDTFDEEGRFELFYVNKGVKVLLNDPDGLDLHDEYNALTNDL